jgi:hypothetical protein
MTNQNVYALVTTGYTMEFAYLVKIIQSKIPIMSENASVYQDTFLQDLIVYVLMVLSMIQLVISVEIYLMELLEILMITHGGVAMTHTTSIYSTRVAESVPIYVLNVLHILNALLVKMTHLLLLHPEYANVMTLIDTIVQQKSV